MPFKKSVEQLTGKERKGSGRKFGVAAGAARAAAPSEQAKALQKTRTLGKTSSVYLDKKQKNIHVRRSLVMSGS